MIKISLKIVLKGLFKNVNEHLKNRKNKSFLFIKLSDFQFYCADFQIFRGHLRNYINKDDKVNAIKWDKFKTG